MSATSHPQGQQTQRAAHSIACARERYPNDPKRQRMSLLSEVIYSARITRAEATDLRAEIARLDAQVEPRTCGFCGEKDPRWNGHDGSGWRKVQVPLAKYLVDCCPDCAWMQCGPDPADQLEAARTDPRGLGDGLGRA